MHFSIEHVKLSSEGEGNLRHRNQKVFPFEDETLKEDKK